VVDVNFATPENRAEVISGQNTSELLTGNRNEHLGCAYHVIDNKSNITVKLGHPWYVNHIKILLGRGHARYESLLNNKIYYKIVVKFQCLFLFCRSFAWSRRMEKSC
jgi:hypothetical protein